MLKDYLTVIPAICFGLATLGVLAVYGCGSITATDKAELVTAAQQLTDAAFTAGAPVLSEAASALPPEVQLLVQAGYGALRKAVEVAEAQGIDHLGAQTTIQAVADTADALHDAVHSPDVTTATAPQG